MESTEVVDGADQVHRLGEGRHLPSQTPTAPHAFDTVICAEGGEVTVERYARVKHGQIVCQPCAGQE